MKLEAQINKLIASEQDSEVKFLLTTTLLTLRDFMGPKLTRIERLQKSLDAFEYEKTRTRYSLESLNKVIFLLTETLI